VLHAGLFAWFSPEHDFMERMIRGLSNSGQQPKLEFRFVLVSSSPGD